MYKPKEDKYKDLRKEIESAKKLESFNRTRGYVSEAKKDLSFGPKSIRESDEHYISVGLVKADELRKAGKYNVSLNLLSEISDYLIRVGNQRGGGPEREELLKYLHSTESRLGRLARQAIKSKDARTSEGSLKYADKLNLLITKNTYTGVRGSNLERNISGIMGLLGLLVGIFFLSSNITGNVIGNSTTSNIFGVILLLVGVIGAFFWFRGRNVKKLISKKKKKY